MSKGKFIGGSCDLFSDKLIMKNLSSIIFFTTGYNYVVEMENGLIRFDPYVDPEHPKLENFKVHYY
jgi:hypothetical protein